MNSKNKPERKRSVDTKYILKMYWGFLRPYLGSLILIAFCIIIAETLFLGDKFLFKILIDNGNLFMADKISKDSFVYIASIIALIFVAAAISRTIFRFGIQHFKQNLELKIMADLKRKFFNHILGLSHNFHTTHRTGSLISRLVRGGRAIEDLTDFFFDSAFPFVFQLIVVGASLIYLDFISAIIVFSVTAVFIIYSLFIQHYQRKAKIVANDADDFEKGYIGDVFTNVDSVKYFGKEKNIQQKFFEYSGITKDTFKKYWGYYKFNSLGSHIILTIGTFLVVYFPLRGFIGGRISLGTVVFIYTVYVSFHGTVSDFIRRLRSLYQALADFDSLGNYAKIQNEIIDSPNAKPLNVNEGMIEFKNVSFKYNQRAILSGFNLKIDKNEKVALVGYSGSGKTTLVKLLYRLYDIGSGEINIDGQDIRDVNQESLRSELSIVPQECILFDDTIYNNILFSNPKASREDVLNAMRLAQLDKIVKSFPDKENTIVGERGIKLSGGEKQRVSIARALIANKKIVVLDEATSSLDSQTEHEIQRDLEQLLKDRTAIIIAHRLSTIMKADKIVVLDNGKIVQIGKHSQLIRRSGMYKKLWNLQKGGYIQDEAKEN